MGSLQDRVSAELAKKLEEIEAMRDKLKKTKDASLRAKRAAAEMYEQLTAKKSEHGENTGFYEAKVNAAGDVGTEQQVDHVNFFVQIETLTQERDALLKTVSSLKTRLDGCPSFLFRNLVTTEFTFSSCTSL